MTNPSEQNIDLLSSVEKTLLSFPEGTPTWEEVTAWADTEQINNRHHGTWYKKDVGPYIYIKPEWVVDNNRMGQKALILLEYFKQKGLLHPQTQFKIIFNHNEELQVLACMPKLEEFDPELNGKDKRQIIATNINERDGYAGAFAPNSHVLEWVKRLIPDFDESSDPGPIFSFISNCITEGSYPSNWGWDPKTGIAYPVDVEVIRLRNDNWPPEQEKMADFLASFEAKSS